MDPQSQEPPSSPQAGWDRYGIGPAKLLSPRTLRSWLILVGSLGLALAIYYGFLGSRWVEYVATWTAHWTSDGLNLLGASTRVDGTILSSNSVAFNIVAECTAVGPLVLFIGAVIAYPASLRAKGLGEVSSKSV